VKADTHGLLNDAQLLEVRHAHLERLSAVFAGETLRRAFVLHGIPQLTQEAPLDWETWLDEALDALAREAERAHDPMVFRPLVVSWDPRGVHFIDHLFRAETFQLENGGWQARCLDTPIGELRRPDPAGNETWRQVRAFTRAFLQRQVAGVFLGMPTLSSALNIAVNLYGQRILEAMALEPEAARHDMRVINDCICELHRWYLDIVPDDQRQCVAAPGRCQPPGFGQLCGCTCQLLSPALYDEFILPLDDEVLSLHPHGGMIHLCGVHTQHIPAWRAMGSLRAVQMNDRAADDLELYFNGLREDQVLYVNAYRDMPVRRALEITGGERTVIVADLQAPPPRGPDSPPGEVTP